MSDFPWFRMYNETLNDPKLKRIATVTKQPKALINGVWAGLLCLASESPDRGKLLISDDMPYLLEEIIEAVGVDFELGELIIDYLVRLELVLLEGDMYTIAKWAERQPKSDSSTERVRRYRQRQAAKKTNDMNGGGDGYYPKRDSNVSSNVTETESNVIESDKDIDKEYPTTTTCTHEDDGSDLDFGPIDDGFASISKAYQNEIGALSPMISDGIKTEPDEVRQILADQPQGDETAEQWILYAIEQAVLSNVRRWDYTKGVINGVKKSKSLSAHKLKQPRKGNSYASNSRRRNKQDEAERNREINSSRGHYNPYTGETFDGQGNLVPQVQ